jgi:hypothetical protein
MVSVLFSVLFYDLVDFFGELVKSCGYHGNVHFRHFEQEYLSSFVHYRCAPLF